MILALDPGKRTGWALSHGECGTLDLSQHDDLGGMCDHFERWLAGMTVAYRVQRVVIERAFGRSAFTSTLPDQLTAIAHMVAHRAGISRSEMTASAIKKAVTGNGRATKAAVMAGVALDGWEPDSDHAADACALLMAWRAKGVAEAGPKLTLAAPVAPL